MKRSMMRGAAVPFYLLLCLLLGGSVQGTWRVMVLQLLALALIGWAASARRGEALTGASRGLLSLVVIALLLFVAQLVPLPPSVWSSLPGREEVANGYAALGFRLPALPISLAPYATLQTALTFLPPLAVLLAIIRLHAHRQSWLAIALLLGALGGVLLGTVQTLGGPQPGAWWYLYDLTNSGAVGFFANRNHMGTLLLTSIPFAVALIASGLGSVRSQSGRQGLLVAGVGGLLLLIVGLVLNRSTAAILLALPVIVFSALLLPVGHHRQRPLIVAAALLTVAGFALYTSNPIQAELAGTDTTSLDTRLWMWSRSWAAIQESFPVGTGLGTFEQVFRLFEHSESVGRTYANHAHNDYLELLLETGVVGMVLLVAFLLWWARQAGRVWQSPISSHYARAATIASGSILAHSLVDYPLRTAALASVFGMCIALMAQGRRQRESAGSRPQARHVTIG